MHEPGPIIASGRDADIYDYGPGLVLRRARSGRPIADEARIMEFARARGVPTPAIEEVSDDGLSIVMERIEGDSMVDLLGRRPWAIRHYADLLADLHLRLHAIEAPPWLPDGPGAPGDRLLHIDLHPLNVMVAGGTAVLIDWARASRGDPATDVGITWLLSVAGHVDSGPVMRVLIRFFRARFVNRFLSHFDLATITPHLPALVEWKVGDPNMSAEECETMRRLAHAHA